MHCIFSMMMPSDDEHRNSNNMDSEEALEQMDVEECPPVLKCETEKPEAGTSFPGESTATIESCAEPEHVNGVREADGDGSNNVENFAESDNEGNQDERDLADPREAAYKMLRALDVGPPKIDISDMKLSCTSCKKSVSMKPGAFGKHPILGVILCEICYDYISAPDWYSTDENGIGEQCSWCAEGGNLVMCDKCTHSICRQCLRRNLDRSEVKRILDLDVWTCFVCDSSPLKKLQDIADAVFWHAKMRVLAEDKKKADAAQSREKRRLSKMSKETKAKRVRLSESASVCSNDVDSHDAEGLKGDDDVTKTIADGVDSPSVKSTSKSKSSPHSSEKKKSQSSVGKGKLSDQLDKAKHKLMSKKKMIDGKKGSVSLSGGASSSGASLAPASISKNEPHITVTAMLTQLEHSASKYVTFLRAVKDSLRGCNEKGQVESARMIEDRANDILVAIQRHSTMEQWALGHISRGLSFPTLTQESAASTSSHATNDKSQGSSSKVLKKTPTKAIAPPPRLVVERHSPLHRAHLPSNGAVRSQTIGRQQSSSSVSSTSPVSAVRSPHNHSASKPQLQSRPPLSNSATHTAPSRASQFAQLFPHYTKNPAAVVNGSTSVVDPRLKSSDGRPRPQVEPEVHTID